MVGVSGFEPPTSWSQGKLEKRRRPLASFLSEILPDRNHVNQVHCIGICHAGQFTGTITRVVYES